MRNRSQLHRRMTAALMSSMLCIMSTGACAEGVFIDLHAGWSDADFSEPVFSNGDGIGIGGDDAILVGGLFAGYEWSNNVFVQAGIEGYQNLTVVFLTDSLELSAFKTSVGYYLPGNSKFRVRGNLGLNFWKLDARESLVFNPGDEERRSLDGTDLFAEVGAEYRFNNALRAGLALSYTDFDVGSATALKLTFKFLP